MLAGVPKAAGVYLMKNAFGEIVYVGKAKNLRDRVGSYFSQQLGYTRKMDGLLESLAAIETVVVGNELQALLLESQLIRRYQPRYNTALRSHEQYPFIRVDVATAWPRITLAKSRKNDGARYFGPFRSASSARRTVDLLNRVVPLRTCSRSFRDARSYGSPCIELDLGRCLGPCVGRADRDTYRALVRDVVAYLDGHDDALYQLLWKGLEEAAEKLDFEKAEKLRRELRDAGAVVGSQRRIREATETGRCLLVLPAEAQGERDLLLIAGGRIWAQLRMGTEDGRTDFGGRLLRSWERLRAAGLPTIDHDSVDEAHILHRWLVRQGRLPGLIRLSDEPNWEAVVDAILALRDEDLPVDFRRLEEMDEALDVPTRGAWSRRSRFRGRVTRRMDRPFSKRPAGLTPTCFPWRGRRGIVEADRRSDRHGPKNLRKSRRREIAWTTATGRRSAMSETESGMDAERDGPAAGDAESKLAEVRPRCGSARSASCAERAPTRYRGRVRRMPGSC
jgi:excinuclease UvrABC nuclease subunit